MRITPCQSGYRVTPELIERVRSGSWNPDAIEADRNQRDARAARGYRQAFQRVKISMARVLNNENAETVINADHGSWYRELFDPRVASGLLGPADIAGYRSIPVFIRRSTHVPPTATEKASSEGDIIPFTQFLGELARKNDVCNCAGNLLRTAGQHNGPQQDSGSHFTAIFK